MRVLAGSGRLWRGAAILAVSLSLAACGGPSATPAPEAGKASAPAAGGALREVASAAMQDIDKLPEPAENQVGGMPKEDLTATPKRGGKLRYAGIVYTRFDPHFPAAPFAERFSARMWNIGLVKWNLKCNCPEADLAESWQTSSDGLTYTFKLRKGVKFQSVPPVNGRPVTIQDVKWSMDRISGLDGKEGRASLNYLRFASVKEWQVVDDNTIKAVLKEPDVNFMLEMMYQFTVVLPKEAAGADGYFNEQKTMVGAGPFIVTLAQNTGLNTYKRNPDFYLQGKPYLDEMTVLSGADRATTQAALAAAQLDMTQLPHVQAKPFFGRKDMRVYNTKGTGVGSAGYYMNVNLKPFDDVRVRRAMNLGIDRWEMIDTVYDGGYYVWGFLGAWQPWHWSEAKLKTLPGFAEDKTKEYEEAKKLLAEAGYPNGFTVECQCEDVIQEEGKVFVEQMKRIGITIQLKEVSSQVHRTTEYSKDKPLSNATMGGGHTPDHALTQHLLCKSVANLSAFCDEKIDAMYKEQRAMTDPQARVKKLDEIQQRLWELMPVAPTGRGTAYHLAYKFVRGWRNPFYDCCNAHSDDLINVWMDQ